MSKKKNMKTNKSKLYVVMISLSKVALEDLEGFDALSEHLGCINQEFSDVVNIDFPKRLAGALEDVLNFGYLEYIYALTLSKKYLKDFLAVRDKSIFRVVVVDIRDCYDDLMRLQSRYDDFVLGKEDLTIAPWDALKYLDAEVNPWSDSHTISLVITKFEYMYVASYLEDLENTMVDMKRSQTQLVNRFMDTASKKVMKALADVGFCEFMKTVNFINLGIGEASSKLNLNEFNVLMQDFGITFGK